MNKVNIYQWKDDLVQDGYIDWIKDTFDEDDAESCFDLANWSCWTKKKPTTYHSTISWIGHGLILNLEFSDIYWLALSVGWMKGTRDEIIAYIKTHLNEEIWL